MASSVLFVFLDGVGLGPAGDENNPLARLTLPAWERLAGNQAWTSDTRLVLPDHVFAAIDATLGVEGLPQSGTGQATLFTGRNCARIAGRHYGPFPHSRTRPLLASDNLFHQIQRLFPEHEEPGVFANAYPDRFFSYVERTDRWTVTTRCCLDAGIRIRTHADLRAGTALPADLTGHSWPQPDPALLPISAYDAGQRFARLGSAHPFTLFEYFLTDKAGHSQSMDRAADVLQALDRFFTGLLDTVDAENALLVVTSDHGNIEDLGTKSHTRNPVPLVAYGRGASHFSGMDTLADVAPAILSALAP